MRTVTARIKYKKTQFYLLFYIFRHFSVPQHSLNLVPNDSQSKVTLGCALPSHPMNPVQAPHFRGWVVVGVVLGAVHLIEMNGT
jgi:hypothetical protein